MAFNIKRDGKGTSGQSDKYFLFGVPDIIYEK
jgi:hypothetical protein